ncbi:hypothetical protein [Streptomyces sp. NPDC012888]|uniref:hypothetical protein n=1 Tax=Streptomyces sp. NPDC012888 TaxID=3364855 RepID=UPI0036B7579C
MDRSFANDESGGGHFRVYRSPGKTLDPSALSRVNCVPLLARKCVDRERTPGLHHTYAVTAVDPDGNESALSTPMTVRSGDVVPPGPVTGLRGTPRKDGVLLRWTVSPEDDVVTYNALRGAARADGTIEWLDTCDDGTADPLAILCTDVPDGETYVYTVVAKDRWDNRLVPGDPRAARVTVKELNIRPSVTVTHVGPLFSTTSTVDLPSIRWECNDSTQCGEVAGYRVTRWNTSTKAYEPLHSGLLPTTATSYTDHTATRGNTYFYMLQALRRDGSAVATHAYDCILPVLV